MNPLLDGAVRIAQELGTSLDYLTGLADDPRPVAELLARLADRPSVPGDDSGISEPVEVRGIAAVAGASAKSLDERFVGSVWVSRAWFVRSAIDPGRCCVMSVSGGSMEPTLMDGCSVLVDRGDRTLCSGNIYVLLGDEGLVVRRAIQNRDGWWLMADNSSLAPRFLSEDDDIIGRVRRVFQDL
jgi:phage repressor protein C with HTH and peptisase S24 domain